jgi:hypothetical protein
MSLHRDFCYKIAVSPAESVAGRGAQERSRRVFRPSDWPITVGDDFGLTAMTSKHQKLHAFHVIALVSMFHGLTPVVQELNPLFRPQERPLESRA